MATYLVTGINVGTFNLGEADKLITIFTCERGLVKAVAKGARKPGAKVAGRAELLNINKLLLATGRSLDIITQAESVETFPQLRGDLLRLTYALYYAELTQHFGAGLSEENQIYFQFLRQALRSQAELKEDPAWLCLKFELGLLNMLGYQPELTYCVVCRQALLETTLGIFHQDLGGIICKKCLANLSKRDHRQFSEFSLKVAREITPLVWKHLILGSNSHNISTTHKTQSALLKQPLAQARKIIESYIEYRANKKMKSLMLVDNLGCK